MIIHIHHRFEKKLLLVLIISLKCQTFVGATVEEICPGLNTYLGILFQTKRNCKSLSFMWEPNGFSLLAIFSMMMYVPKRNLLYFFKLFLKIGENVDFCSIQSVSELEMPFTLFLSLNRCLSNPHFFIQISRLLSINPFFHLQKLAHKFRVPPS